MLRLGCYCLRLQVLKKEKIIISFIISPLEAKDELLINRIRQLFRENNCSKVTFVIFESGVESLENNLSDLLKYNYSLFKDNLYSEISDVA